MAIIDAGTVKVDGTFTVQLGSFSISLQSISNRQYAEFLRQKREQEEPQTSVWFMREPDEAALDAPVVGVNWYDTMAYCRWLSECTERQYTLPNEAEWKKRLVKREMMSKFHLSQSGPARSGGVHMRRQIISIHNTGLQTAVSG